MNKDKLWYISQKNYNKALLQFQIHANGWLNLLHLRDFSCVFSSSQNVFPHLPPTTIDQILLILQGQLKYHFLYEVFCNPN